MILLLCFGLRVSGRAADRKAVRVPGDKEWIEPQNSMDFFKIGVTVSSSRFRPGVPIRTPAMLGIDGSQPIAGVNSLAERRMRSGMAVATHERVFLPDSCSGERFLGCAARYNSDTHLLSSAPFSPACDAVRLQTSCARVEALRLHLKHYR